ncbi:MAG: helix-turn-helix domain-containing protein [Candidatus Aquicultorales bacterium]
MKEMKLGELIKNLREERKLSKKKLAREALISDAYLIQIERGDRNPSEKVLRRLALALNVRSYVLLVPAGIISTEALEQVQKRFEGRFNSNSEEEDEMIRSLFIERHLDAGNPFFWPKEAEPGPEGWHEISSKDRELVQSFIDRLRFVADEG